MFGSIYSFKIYLQLLRIYKNQAYLLYINLNILGKYNTWHTQYYKKCVTNNVHKLARGFLTMSCGEMSVILQNYLK